MQGPAQVLRLEPGEGRTERRRARDRAAVDGGYQARLRQDSDEVFHVEVSPGLLQQASLDLLDTHPVLQKADGPQSFLGYGHEVTRIHPPDDPLVTVVADAEAVESNCQATLILAQEERRSSPWSKRPARTGTQGSTTSGSVILRAPVCLPASS